MYCRTLQFCNRAVLLSFAFLSACTSSAPDSGGLTLHDREALLSKRLARGLEMRAFLSRDTVDRNEPVEVLFFIVNGPTPMPFLNHPSRIGVTVETESGASAPISSSHAVDATPGTQVQLTLPANGIFGQRENLYCIENSGYAPRRQPGSCEVQYDLSSPGRYRVIVQYSAPRDGPFAHPVIADTAMLVVK